MSRVAMVSTVHQPLDGRILFKEAASLRDGGHEVTLIARRGAGPTEDATAEVEGLGVRFDPLAVPGSKLGRLRLWVDVLGRLRRGGYDVWHFHDPELLPLLVVWRWFVRPSPLLVYDVHEDLSVDVFDKLWIPAPLRPAVSRLWRLIDRLGSRSVDLVVACTPTIAEKFSPDAPSTVTVRNYPLSVVGETNATAPRSPTDGPVGIVYVGGVSVARGALEMVDAVESLEGAAHLDIYGPFIDGSAEAAITARRPRHTTVHGRVPFTEVPEKIAAADIGLALLHPTPKYVRSLPVKIFEYYRGRCAVVASDFDAWRDLVPHEVGRLVDPLDVDAIAAAISDLTSDRAVLAGMGERAAELVAERFSWERESSTLLDAYTTLSARA